MDHKLHIIVTEAAITKASSIDSNIADLFIGNTNSLNPFVDCSCEEVAISSINSITRIAIKDSYHTGFILSSLIAFAIDLQLLAKYILALNDKLVIINISSCFIESLTLKFTIVFLIGFSLIINSLYNFLILFVFKFSYVSQ